MKEECGIFGIYSSRGLGVAEEVYLGLSALQHRGQESCGIAVSNDGKFSFKREGGTVLDVFDEESLSELGNGQIAVGHVRYDPFGRGGRESAQPLVLKYAHGSLAVCNNGALTNRYELRAELERDAAIFQTDTDAELIAYIIARERIRSGSIETAMANAMDKLQGAYSVLIMSPHKLIAARDPLGIRPLSLGKIGGSWVVASETCAFDTIGAEFVRDIEPGEVIMLNHEGLHSIKAKKAAKSALCIFEYVYFSRPDSVLMGQSVHLARRLAGKILAQEHPIEADLVCGVPDSGIDAALGYAEESGIPYGIGLVKNEFIGRVFIQDTQQKRERLVSIKLNALSAAVKGKRIVLVDDSIVRGTTCTRIVGLLREAGAKEVHVRISSPPFVHPCFFGTDIKSKESLMANRLPHDGLCKALGADTLGYLSVAGIRSIAPQAQTGFCDACFTGEYPIEVPEEIPFDKYSHKIKVSGGKS
ncbi:MAG: amidophosphoribosyltransferase [Oscillospiraceae bacterium]|jgi:amidophosphoribosyltransferase|nr:amidophosphoribosyltransferase [Oscillospiraceae bacterium]